MSTVNAREIEHFAKDAGRWWDADGPFRPLHRLNPVRLSYIKERICAAYGRDMKALDALDGLSVLDIGCGGGLVSEPMARLGADVTGVDADGQAIAAARTHARDAGLAITYREGSTETLISEKMRFDVVLALEIIEHTADPAAFVAQTLDLCKPGGIVVFSTLNRTAKSFALGKVAAEYVLGWVPRGTHDWKKFVRPSELARLVRAAGGRPMALEGMAFDPLAGRFGRSRDTAVNYFMTAEKPNV